ncbi:MAG: sigma 54-dependent Fis family transcriptional regulator [Deltaproteobacteria bacterium]|nr:sigma 54-dependent Fis family transcriptional regulator [Deltaproteobacteria bacterium]
MELAPRNTVLETGIATGNLGNRAGVRSCLCRVISGPNVGVEVALGARPLVIGAEAGCDVVLADPKVSRRHVELQLRPAGVFVHDLESRNGTFAQGAQVTTAILPFGTAIKVGDTSIRIVEPSRPSVPPSQRERFGGLVGRSAAMREVYSVLDLASPTNATVLLEGESGTGKELAARAIHDHSPRANAPFVVLDCSAVKEELFESHAFGHVRGAFTGAVADRRGAFVQADGGTLFLDEIGELSPTLQAKLLRALEAQTVQPLGSEKVIKVNTRVVTATHRNLTQMVDDQTFRFDLYHRLSVVHLLMPPLRERPDDVADLVRAFFEGRGTDPGEIGGENLERLKGYAWAGNVRELRNVLERATVFSGRASPTFAELKIQLQGGALKTGGEEVDTALSFKEAKEAWVAVFERRYLADVFERFKRNITHAARHSDINRRHFAKLLRKYGIIADDGD